MRRTRRDAGTVGITYEDKGSRAGRIDMMVGYDADTNTSHTISNPMTVKVENTADGDINTRLIDGEVGETKALICFLSAT